MNITDIKRAQLAKFDPAKPVMKVLQVLTLAAEPSEKQIELIKPYLLRDFSADELYIRQMELANDQYDRSFERFDRGYLRRFAETIVGKSVLIGHEYGNAPVGRFFDAAVAKGTNGWQWVKPWFYMPISSGNQLARDNIDSGVWSYVSIGAYVDYAGLICDICGQPYYYWLADDFDWETVDCDSICRHIAGQEYEGQLCTCTFTAKKSDMSKVEAVEGSIVYLGCQYDAAIAKSADIVSAQRLFKETLLGDAEPHTTDPAAEQAPDGDTKEASEMELIEKLKSLLGLEVEEPEAIVADIERRIAEAEDLRKQADRGAALWEWVSLEVSRLADCVGNTAAKRLAKKCDTVEELLQLHAELSAEWSEKRAPKPQAQAETPDEAAPIQTKAADLRAFSVI